MSLFPTGCIPPMLPFSFTTSELEALRVKLSQAEHQIRADPTHCGSIIIGLTLAEVHTLQKMVDLTYLQGISASQSILPQTPTGSLPTFQSAAPMLASPPAFLTDDRLLHAATSGNGMAFNGGFGAEAMGGRTPRGQRGRSPMEKMRFRQMNPRTGAPPVGYVCHRCGDNDHYVENCRTSEIGARPKTTRPPPESYVCHKCNIPGHWIFDCPLQQQQPTHGKAPPAKYVCHRCGVPGHWIKECPELVLTQTSSGSDVTVSHSPHSSLFLRNVGSV